MLEPRPALLRNHLGGDGDHAWSLPRYTCDGKGDEVQRYDRCNFRDGLISEYRTTYDRLDLLQQLGVLPKEDGLGFKIMAFFSIVRNRDRKALHR